MTNILTLDLDPLAQDFFQRQRQSHYPAHLNRIAAHLTLFHTLPDEPDVASVLHHGSLRPPFRLQVTGVRSLGGGVAYTVSSPVLQALQSNLARAFGPHLTPQDRQRFQPHVVVQNKATPDLARALLAQLEREFVPFEVEAQGLHLWHYLGGPWQHVQAFPFSA